MESKPQSELGAPAAPDKASTPSRAPVFAILAAAAVAITAAGYLLHIYLRKTYGAEVVDSVIGPTLGSVRPGRWSPSPAGRCRCRW